MWLLRRKTMRMRKAKLWIALGLFLFCLPLLQAKAASKAELEQRIQELEGRTDKLSHQLDEMNIRLEMILNRMETLEKDIHPSPEAKAQEKGTSMVRTPENLEVIKLKPGPSAQPSSASPPPPPGPRPKITLSPWPSEPVLRVGDVTMSSQPQAEIPSLPDKDTETMALYQEGVRLYENKDYQAAVEKFEDFLSEVKGDKDLDRACFWLGECYYNLGDKERARENFERITDDYPESPKAPEALFKIGLIYIEQDDDSKAREAFRDLTILYPFSDLVREAENKLKEINSRD
jgi:tol-pal system protein YbgF